jgi:hypothetical protein
MHSDGTKNGFRMAVAMLATKPARWLRHLFRRGPRVETLALRDYQSAVTPLLERAECLYQQWREQMETGSDSERIANIASTQSWEMASLGSRLEACTPPAGLESLHARCAKAFVLARRAGQLLSTGHRYHNADALCDGHAALDDARQLYLSALSELADLASAPAKV